MGSSITVRLYNRRDSKMSNYVIMSDNYGCRQLWNKYKYV